MEKIDSLFYLIKSLSKAQKRYFKINTPHVINGQNNYMKLFDALENQREYDEEQILKDFPGETFVKHLPSEKNYLYELILKTMRAFQSEKNTLTKLTGMVQDITFLNENKMEIQAYKKLRKAKKIAEQSEEFSLLLELLSIEKDLILSLHPSEAEEVLHSIRATESQVSEILLSEKNAETLILATKLLSYYDAEEKKSEWNELRKSIERLENVSPLSVKINIALLHFHAMDAAHHSLYDSSEKHYESLISKWDEHQELLENESSRYKKIIKEYAILVLALNKLDVFNELMKTVNQIEPQNTRDEIEDIKSYLFYEFEVNVQMGRFDVALGLLPKIDEKLEYYRYLIDPSDLVNYYFQISILFFLTDKPKQVSKWISRIKRLKTEAQMDTQVFACFIEILAHFEARKETHMQYILRTNYQFINDRPKLNHFQSTINRNIRKIIKLKSKDQIIDVLFKLRSEMLLYKEAKIESKLIGVNEIIIWIDGQIKGISVNKSYLDSLKESVA